MSDATYEDRAQHPLRPPLSVLSTCRVQQRKQLAKEFAELLRVMSHPDRLGILEQLLEGEKDVKTLLQALDLPGPRISQHLRLLRAHRIVEERQDGRHRVYRLTQPQLAHWLTRGLERFERSMLESEHSMGGPT